jgi:hypothetical protein
MTDIHGTPEPEPFCHDCDELEQEVELLKEKVTKLEAAVEKLKNPVSYTKTRSPYDCSARRHIGERRP